MNSHFFTDISGGPVSVDVGMCRSHCGGTVRTPHHAGQQEYAKHTSMLEFLRSKKVGGVSLLRPQGRAVTLKKLNDSETATRLMLYEMNVAKIVREHYSC